MAQCGYFTKFINLCKIINMNKKILIGVCGSISAYKTPIVIRRLKEKKWDVKVIMTESATKFITPLTLETVSKNSVYIDMFEKNRWDMHHIGLSEFAKTFLIIPATANILGKTANGIADDLLSATIMSFKEKIVFAPAMNYKMWENPIVQENVKKLKKHGYYFVGPVKGSLAEGSGWGRLAKIKDIVTFIEKIFDK
jgi:phosphopantothenoylcysteine decarboxylase/phosphopantothenate--cysteine ligase